MKNVFDKLKDYYQVLFGNFLNKKLTQFELVWVAYDLKNDKIYRVLTKSCDIKKYNVIYEVKTLYYKFFAVRIYKYVNNDSTYNSMPE